MKPITAAIVAIPIVPIAAVLLLTVGWVILPAMIYLTAAVEEDKRKGVQP